MNQFSEAAAWLGQTASLHPVFAFAPVLAAAGLWTLLRRRARSSPSRAAHRYGKGK